MPEALLATVTVFKTLQHNRAMAVLVIGGLFFELPLLLAVIGHEGGTVLVVLNGLRLLRDPIRGRETPPASSRLVDQSVPRHAYQRKIARRAV